MSKFHFKTVIFFISVLLAAACNPTEEEQATGYLEQATGFYRQGSYVAAKEMLDSLHRLFPRQVDTRRQADTLLWRIDYIELENLLPRLDSMLITVSGEAEQLSGGFLLKKDEKYRQTGIYEHRSMRTEINVARNYLKPVTTEQGDFSFTSHYVGQALSLHTITAVCNDIFIETPPISATQLHTFTNLGVTYETVLFLDSEAEDFCRFIVEHAAQPVTIKLLGNKTASYTMNRNDRTVFADTYRFAQALKKIHQLQEQKIVGEHRRAVIRQRLQL
ncbi:MAG: hypothetical protein LBS16_08010 [Prevotellaceae bacterium]|jgi:hypothetical protein|nr:hypothetical protein [Prevotellaceae bacterium]